MSAREHSATTSPLLADLYQFTMLQAYWARAMHDTAVFELFVRKLPPTRNFLVAAGLEQALAYLENLRFDAEDVAALRATELFGEEFLAWLATVRFTGDVDAMPEGTPFFANEPILRVTAPLPAAQLVESRLVNLLNFQTAIASKAARCVLAAPGKTLIDFGMRRAHGAEAALLAARASYLAGFAGTATTLAHAAYGIPVFGTMAHSFVQAHDSERAAFEHFLDVHRGPIVLLIDTYDTLAAAREVVALSERRTDKRISAVRLDSGDLGLLARQVRALFDATGHRDIGIFASGNLNEHRLHALLSGGAPIDAFGVGTSLDVSDDAPALDCVYKLQEYAGRPRRKRSTGKATWPGAKQVYRHYGADGTIERDVLAPLDAREPGRALLEPALRAGQRVAAPAPLAATRDYAARQLATLPPELRSLARHEPLEVAIAPSLVALTERVDREFH